MIDSTITLPCGLELENRLMKAAMSAPLGHKGHIDERMVKLHTNWGQGGWGMIMTGNIMIDPLFFGNSADPMIPPTWSSDTNHPDSETELWRLTASGIKSQGSKAIMQLNHPGRQAMSGSRSFFDKNLSPSAVPLNFGSGVFTRGLVSLIWGTPVEMSEDQIQEVIKQHVNAALFAKEVGFDGIEIHAAHGYLLSSFLCPIANVRTDKWGGSPENRARIVVEVIREIRKAVGKNFCVGVKINSADQQDEGLVGGLEQVDVIAREGIDFLEVSGGTYEDPSFIDGSSGIPNAGSKTETTTKREAFFTSFATSIRQRNPDLILILTGGFRTRSGMEAALKSHACDIIGIGRPAALVPDFPRSVLGIGSGKEKLGVEVKAAGMQLPVLKDPWFLDWVPNKQLGRAIKGGAQTMHYNDEMLRQVSVE